MADYTARWRIQGENGMQSAFRSILGDAKSTSDKMGRLFKTAFAGISAVGIAVGLKNAAAEAIRYGDEMQKASARTGLGAAQFAELAGAAKLADVELGTLSKGLRTMQTRLSEAATGAKAPAETFAALGIAVKDFRALKADEQLEVLADQFVKLKDPTDRARAGTDLFGRAWDDLAPFMLKGAEGIREARKEIQALGGALTDQDIARLAEADEAIKRLDASWSGMARTLTAKAAPALAGFFDILRRGFGGGTEIEMLREELAELNRMIDDMEQNDVPLEGINRNIVERRRIVEAQLATLGEYESRGPTRRRSFQGSGDAAPGFKDDPKKKKGAKDAGPFDDIAITARRITTSAMDEMYAEMDRATQTSIEAQLEKWQTAEAQIATLLADGRITKEVADARNQELIDAQFDDIKITAEKIFPKAERTELSVFAEEAGRNLQSHFAAFLFDPFDKGLKGMLQGFADTLRQMAAQAAASELLKMFFSWGSGLGGGVGGFFSSMGKSLGVRDTGGDVKAGSAYMIGLNRKPELFVPGVSGTVMAGAGLGGGISVTVAPVYSIDARGATQDLIKQLPALMEQNKRETVALAVAAVRDNVKRRGRV